MTSSPLKPLPLSKPIPRRKCPICGMSSYSASGVHPQCTDHKNSSKVPKSATHLPANNSLKWRFT
jgi:hypothetical protein